MRDEVIACGGARLPFCDSYAEGCHRMIIYPKWTGDTDSLGQIKDRLEIEETVATLLLQPGQQADGYDGTAVRASHPPVDNYVIGHGVAGLPHWFSGDVLAGNLVARGLQTGDRIWLVCCSAAEPLTVDDSAAQELATGLGKLNVPNVVIFASRGYVNWNAGGPLLIRDYVTSDVEVKKAGKAWTRAEDKAWNAYVADLRKAITGALAKVPADHLVTVHGLIDAFATSATRNASDLSGRVAKAAPKVDPEAARKVYVTVVNDASPREDPSRAEQHRRWSEALRGLLADVHTQVTDLLRGKAAAGQEVSQARATLYAALGKAWPAYSTGYYDRLRALAASSGKSMPWEQFTS
ncbi:hypothetical protein O7632_15925 [Solwaraspora sp. WMMD406]|uniref:hypothetical protein n=1 Tax=Solwaraspora sp. WMMD406 TaxID=3016095 RepID=UPI00241757EB|nr:hypothetical protein [Solwaraspora sp. WMMD406]MDG4765573.1 hypothetical protein [Solwaraspora sp. WMMD406]